MPNPSNITRPVTLISYGRSGTSLVFNILSAHPEMDGCGETGTLLFGTWEGAKRLKGVVRPDREGGPDLDHRARCGRAVRAAFLAFFDNPDKRDWVHKPINVPWVIPEPQRRNPAKFEKAAAEYWEIMGHSFPESRNITILRHPYDVVSSALRYWGFPVDKIWRSIVNMAEILDHPDSTISLALSHRRLVEDPAPEIARLLDHVGLSHDPACYAAADTVYVPEMGAGRQPKERMRHKVEAGFSHRGKWADIDMSSFTNRDRDTLVSMWARYGETLEF